MGQTLTQKVLALHCGKKEVHAGELIDAKVDIGLVNDITGPISMGGFEKYNAKLFDPDRMVLVNDHFVPNKDIPSAEQAKIMRDFAKKYHIKYFFDAGNMGIEHILLVEQGIVMPYDVVIGADSHTCTYGALSAFSTGVGSTDLAGVMMSGKVWLKVPEAIKFVLNGDLQKYTSGKDVILYIIGDIGVDGALYKSMEFTGEGAKGLDISDRLTISNMAIEAGAKNGIFEFDFKTMKHLMNTEKFKENTRTEDFKQRWNSTLRDYVEDGTIKADKNAEYVDVKEYNLSEIEPQVAFPHSPGNVKPISDVETNPLYVDQVVMGLCTNGKIEDLRAFAKVLKGHKVHEDVRLIVIPGTQYIAQQGMNEGIAQMIINAEGVYSTPTCGPCLGGHMGVLAAGEKCLSTTNRNFIGRMGEPGDKDKGIMPSEVYLANPEIAAATAVMGYICSPSMLKGGRK